jgi:hypothetical protein
MHALLEESDDLNASKQIKIQFEKISYDRIFTSMMKQYVEEHPDVEVHAAFDIIRSQADQKYLDSVKMYCDEESYDAQNINAEPN